MPKNARDPNLARLLMAAKEVEHGPCILCGRASCTTLFWFPDGPATKRLGVPIDKQRVHYVAVCEEHEPESEDVSDPIFQQIKAKLIAKHQVH